MKQEATHQQIQKWNIEMKKEWKRRNLLFMLFRDVAPGSADRINQFIQAKDIFLNSLEFSSRSIPRTSSYKHVFCQGNVRVLSIGFGWCFLKLKEKHKLATSCNQAPRLAGVLCLTKNWKHLRLSAKIFKISLKILTEVQFLSASRYFF